MRYEVVVGQRNRREYSFYNFNLGLERLLSGLFKR